jgi:ATP-binding cassette subfamily B protein
MRPFTLLCVGVALADTLAIPSPLKAIRQHYALLEEAKALQRQPLDPMAGVDAAECTRTEPKSSVEAQPPPPVTWQRLWRELRTTQQVGLVVPASALSLVLTASELAVPRLRGQLFDAALLPGATLRAMVPRLTTLALLALSSWVIHIVSATLFARARWSAAMAGRVRLMDALLSQEPSFFDAQKPGELNSRLLSEPERLESLANRGPERALSAVLSLGGALVLMLAMDWRLTVVAIALRAPLISKLAEAAGKHVGLLGVLQQHALSEANALASEALAHPHSVAAHAARETILAEYTRRCRGYTRVIRATLVSETLLRFTRLAIDSVTNLLLLGFGLLAVLQGRVSLGALTAFYAYADRFADGCQRLQELLHEVYTIRPACARLFELLDREPQMAWEGGATPHHCRGELEVVNVSLTFPGREAAALRGVSLRVEAGETLALVGPSGAGKSTLVRLLNRLYTPDDGVVRLDGADVRTLDLRWLRSQFGYVAQHPALFDLSVAENVGFGPTASTVTTADVDGALAAAGADEFVARLPEGSATSVGENGHRLSGGQRQRLAVARALVRSPPILLWDEATSSLDGASERIVARALTRRDSAGGRGAQGGQQQGRPHRRTAVIVAHRLSSVLCADRVVVLRDGRVDQVGTPDELAAAEGWYRDNFGYGGRHE